MGKPTGGWILLSLSVLLANWPSALSAGPGPRLAPPPPLSGGEEGPAPPVALPSSAAMGGEQAGGVVRIHGQPQRAAWRWSAPAVDGSRQLWVPLEVLQGQLGFSSRSRGDGTLELEWFGQTQLVPPARQVSLADEVAVDLAPFLARDGLSASVEGGELRLAAPLAEVRRARASAAPSGQRRVVLELSGPAVVRGGEGRIWLAARVPPSVAAGDLPRLGLGGAREGEGWVVRPPSEPLRVFTLGAPARVVIDLAAPTDGRSATAAPPARPSLDPRLRALLGSDVLWRQDSQTVGGRRLRLNSVRIDPLSSSLELRSLSWGASMEGLTTLPRLASRHDALVAINGGYFNRVRRLPLGALRDQGRWLSGPILNRGVVAWEPSTLPRFGRLDLQEWVSDDSGRQWPVDVVNSGYVKRGLARYTADWGAAYRALSGSERAVVVRDGLVRRRYDGASLAAGVSLGPGEDLLVARAGAPLPWGEGSPLRLFSRPSSDLGQASFVMGGGPLLLQEGRIVLDGTAEGFSPAFLRQGAPRTVIGSDGRYLWLLTLEGVDDEGPTLAETARVLQAAGLREALNLDGGSSTGLVIGGVHTVKGRGVVSAVHNGLGLVPRSGGPASGGAGPGAGGAAASGAPADDRDVPASPGGS
ncbi:MAG: phosphodiester glycosidase family protein [Cyanobacteriota bacterium]